MRKRINATFVSIDATVEDVKRITVPVGESVILNIFARGEIHWFSDNDEVLDIEFINNHMVKVTTRVVGESRMVATKYCLGLPIKAVDFLVIPAPAVKIKVVAETPE